LILINIKFEKDKLEELKVFVIEMCKRFAILYSISENMQSTHFLIAKVIGGRQSEDRNFKYYLDKLDTTITAELAVRAVPEDPIKILIDKRTRVSQKVKDVARPYIAAALNNLGQ